MWEVTDFETLVNWHISKFRNFYIMVKVWSSEISVIVNFLIYHKSVIFGTSGNWLVSKFRNFCTCIMKYGKVHKLV